MEKIKTIFNFLKGKKTYIIGGLMIALGLLTENYEMALQGAGFCGIRLAIK